MWVSKEAVFIGQSLRVMFDEQDGTLQFPVGVEVELNQVIYIGDRSFRVEALSMFRDEAFIAKVVEISANGKSPSGRGGRKSRKSRNQDQGQSGLDSSDGNTTEELDSASDAEGVDSGDTD